MLLKLKKATLVLAFFCLCVPASVSSRRGGFLHLDHMQGNMTHAIICGSGVADPNIFNHASGGRPQTVSGGDQNDGGSQPSKVHGGGTNDHRSNHHNESNRGRNGVDFVTITFTILARLLLHQNI